MGKLGWRGSVLAQVNPTMTEYYYRQARDAGLRFFFDAHQEAGFTQWSAVQQDRRHMQPWPLYWYPEGLDPTLKQGGFVPFNGLRSGCVQRDARSFYPDH